MTWRLGIDLGTNSLGWAALKLEQIDGAWAPVGLRDSGVRIFSDGRNPKDKQSNAVKRREPRGARKNRDRYLRRRARLMRELIEFGLMPDDESARKALEGGKGVPLTDTDPWILRTRALDEQISLHQLGRAIFHLHQRRGFKSNRKTDRADSESGKVYEATRRTKEKLETMGARTLGELFGRPRLEAAVHNQTAKKGARHAQPLARVRKSGEGAKWQYDYYPTRELILDEFDEIWNEQKAYHPDILTNTAHNRLRDTIEWQHPLKSPPVGKCTLIPTEERAAKALPSSQRSRIFQEVNALRIGYPGEVQKELSKEQRDKVVNRLLHPRNEKGTVKFTEIRKKILKLSDRTTFNTESAKRPDLQGDTTAAKMKHKNRWGEGWFDLDLQTQDEIIDRLINEEKEDILVAYLQDVHRLDVDQAFGVADCPLVSGYGSLSKLALDKIQPHLEAGVTVYSEAVTLAGFPSHSNFDTGEVFDKALPYYGYILERHVAFGTGEPKDLDEKRYGKIANPTVHVALNQIRSVVNDLLKRFGPPGQIVIELARDLPLSAKGKGELDKRQKDNQDANEKRRKILAECGVVDNYNNRMRLRLYEELEALGKCCAYTGKHIPLSDLFTDKVEVDHILPFSRTLDDSYSNKVLCMREANRDKGNQTPYEKFHTSPDSYDWEEISKRAAELPPNKTWRFGPDAMERYEKEEGGFLARQLTDTQYISRLAKGYLSAIYPGGKASNVWVIPGRLTADLRWQWGLDSVLHGHNEEISEAQKKNRHDHRHHAIDAIVVACTDIGMLQRAARQARKNEEKFDERLMAGVAEPWAGFRDDVANSVRDIIVSHKPDHGIQDAMLQDSAMSIIHEKKLPPRTAPMVRKYVPIDILTSKELDAANTKSWTVVDENIRRELNHRIVGLTEKEIKNVITSWGYEQKPVVSRLRVFKRESVQPIGKGGYKAYSTGGNYCYDIWLNEKGKWESRIISTFEAYQKKNETKNWEWWRNLIGFDGQKLIMRLRKGDFLKIVDRDDVAKIIQVRKFSGNSIHMHEHFESNASDRISKKEISDIKMATSALQKANAKRVTISPSGVMKVYT